MRNNKVNVSKLQSELELLRAKHETVADIAHANKLMAEKIVN